MSSRLLELYANSQRNRRVALNSYRYGWPIDPQKQAQIAEKIRKRITDADDALQVYVQRLAAEEADPSLKKFLAHINFNSAHQVGKLLYEVLEAPIRIRTEQGAPSVGKAALDQLTRSDITEVAEIATLLQKRKTAAKLEEAYIKNLNGVALVRPAAHVTAQVGGRWSYRDPALQTVPAPIKPMFVAHPDSWMVACDLSQAELRSMAQQSGDEAMMRAYHEGRDIHKETAAAIFGVDVSQVTPQQRKIAKPLGLGFNYSTLDTEAAAAGLYAQVAHMAKGLTFEMLLGALKRLDKARPGIRKFKEACLARALEEDYVEEPLHLRRRYFYGKVKPEEAFNYVHQALIAALIDQAIQGMDEEFQEGEGLTLNRHDEAIIMGPDIARLCALQWKHMRQRLTLCGNDMLYEVDMKISRRWGEGVVIEPTGEWENPNFIAACPCGWKNKQATIEEIALVAGEHYDQCEE